MASNLQFLFLDTILTEGLINVPVGEMKRAVPIESERREIQYGSGEMEEETEMEWKANKDRLGKTNNIILLEKAWLNPDIVERETRRPSIASSQRL